MISQLKKTSGLPLESKIHENCQLSLELFQLPYPSTDLLGEIIWKWALCKKKKKSPNEKALLLIVAFKPDILQMYISTLNDNI